ncbi:EamA-like transporter family protein [Anaerosphaera aminiphila DSM 21120]|uniref:EamA-like transporter family protein n=1 Tax=Anaerosphaera aminiphila DSM 21120 TaxID=1120995 RepID=A0A1M5T1K8_9FIRM|nr:DMT family transporter [Anaerosphaera aminiphila]SHH44659.1 EamA-like transporter family protein [Anaerosphaera aminiphila DSM 21120]
MKSLKSGYIFAITSAVIFGMMPLMTKRVYAIGMSAIDAVFYRNAMSIIILWFMTKYIYKENLLITKGEFIKLLILSIGYVFTPILLYYSYNYISSGAATTIHFSYPIVIFLVSVLIYRERATKREIICIIFAMFGIVMLMDFREVNNILGIVLAFGSGLTYSLYSVWLEKSGLRSMSINKLSFYLILFSSIMAFIVAIPSGGINFNVGSPKNLLVLILYSAILSVGAANLYQRAVLSINAKQTSILSAFEPVTSLIVGFFILHEELSFLNIAAIVLICASTVLLVLSPNENKNKVSLSED